MSDQLSAASDESGGSDENFPPEHASVAGEESGGRDETPTESHTSEEESGAAGEKSTQSLASAANEADANDCGESAIETIADLEAALFPAVTEQEMVENELARIHANTGISRKQLFRRYKYGGLIVAICAIAFIVATLNPNFSFVMLYLLFLLATAVVIPEKWLAFTSGLLCLAGKSDAAVKVSDVALKLDDTEPYCLNTRAVGLLLLHRSQEAEESITAAINELPKMAIAFENRAFARYQQNKVALAEVDASHAIELRPKSWRAFYIRSLIRQKKRGQDALLDGLKDANKTIELAPKSPYGYLARACNYLLMNRIDECAADADKSIKLGSRLEEAKCVKGLAHLVNNQVDEAELIAQQLFKRVPPGGAALLYRSIVSMRRNDYLSCLRDANDFLLKHDTEAGGWYSLASGLFCLNRGREALVAVNRALELLPSYGRAYVTRAAIFERCGRYEDAWRDLDTAEQCNPFLAASHVVRARMHWKRSEHEQALASTDRAIEKFAAISQAHAMRALALVGLQKHKEAISAATEATRLDPDCPAAWLSLGIASEAAENLNEAIGHLDHAIMLNPNDRDGYEFRAALLDKLGCNERADEDRKKVRELSEAFLATRKNQVTISS